jgi:hypothetical protein
VIRPFLAIAMKTGSSLGGIEIILMSAMSSIATLMCVLSGCIFRSILLPAAVMRRSLTDVPVIEEVSMRSMEDPLWTQVFVPRETLCVTNESVLSDGSAEVNRQSSPSSRIAHPLRPL